jgi:hypothetical protein
VATHDGHWNHADNHVLMLSRMFFCRSAYEWKSQCIVCICEPVQENRGMLADKIYQKMAQQWMLDPHCNKRLSFQWRLLV